MSSNSQEIADSSDQNQSSEGSQNEEDSNNDNSQAIDIPAYNRNDQKAIPETHAPPTLPQSALTGRQKSLTKQLEFFYPTMSVNKHELKSFDTMFKSLREDKDWVSFCKILFLYFEGVLSLIDFYKMYEEKFANRLK